MAMVRNTRRPFCLGLSTRPASQAADLTDAPSDLYESVAIPLTMSESDPTVTVRRRWDDPESARVELEHAREFAIKDRPGGICSPIPRPFLYARVWCDHLIEGAAIHTCDPRSAPHELELCVLERDNPDVYASLRAQVRR
jgi:hypothetical protein